MQRSGQLAACTRLHCEHVDGDHVHAGEGAAGDEVLDDVDLQRGALVSATAAASSAATATATVALAATAAAGQAGGDGGAVARAGKGASSACCKAPSDHALLQQAAEPAAAGLAGGGGAGGAVAAKGGNSGYLAEKATMLLLLRGQEAWPLEWADVDAGKAWAALMDTTGMGVVEAEVRRSRVWCRWCRCLGVTYRRMAKARVFVACLLWCVVAAGVPARAVGAHRRRGAVGQPRGQLRLGLQRVAGLRGAAVQRRWRCCCRGSPAAPLSGITELSSGDHSSFRLPFVGPLRLFRCSLLRCSLFCKARSRLSWRGGARRVEHDSAMAQIWRQRQSS